jgi:Asp-tRNA(Asn)/Glu-tRNA(Gln) amidotransferase C subunit
MKSGFETWSFKKSNILSKYTTVEKLSITSSFLSPMSGAMNDKAMNSKSLTTVSEKIKGQLEQLDQFDNENMQEMVNLSQQDYIKRIDELNNALIAAWNEDDRVKSLKIVIQVNLYFKIFKFKKNKFNLN